MKKLLLIASALLAFSFFGCTQSNNSGSSEPVPPAPEPTTTIFASGTLVNGGYGTAEIIDEDGMKVAHIAAGSWMKAIYTPEAPLNIGGKKIKVTAKCGDGYTQGDGLFKLIFVTDDTHQSEITANGEGNVDWCSFTTEYQPYTGTDTWVAYQIDNEADLTNVTQIIINPQSGLGDIWIQNIEFVD
ncbi:MAG: hypothetical protein J5978_09460 [Spirochaetaceae bacterium]|nr:hypothetical protein [Spirochaetaceae bacterium]